MLGWTSHAPVAGQRNRVLVGDSGPLGTGAERVFGKKNGAEIVLRERFAMHRAAGVVIVDP